MKFKIGDKVKLNKNIKDFRYGRAGVSYEEIGTIIRINKYRNTVDFPSHASWDGTEEELVLAKYTYEDLKKSPIGTKITFENGLVLVKVRERDARCDEFTNGVANRNTNDLKNLKDSWLEGYLGKIIKIEEPTYRTVYEAKKEILDEAEKRYLRGVIRPFRDKVKYVKKIVFFDGDTIISIRIEENNKIWYIEFPPFKKDRMYKGMEENKEYTLEELRL